MFPHGSLIPLLPRLPSVEGSPTASATLLATYACALLLATPALGRWVDQRGPRPALLAGLVLLVASTAPAGHGVLLGPVVSGALSRAAGPGAPFLVVAVGVAAATALLGLVLAVRPEIAR